MFHYVASLIFRHDVNLRIMAHEFYWAFITWFSYKTLVSDLVGEHWKRKSKSQPSIYMGGEILSLVPEFCFQAIQRISKVLGICGNYCFHLCRIQLEESHTCREIMSMNHLCKYVWCSFYGYYGTKNVFF